MHPESASVSAGVGSNASLRIKRTEPDCSSTITVPSGIPTIPVDAPSDATATSMNPGSAVAAETSGAATLTTGTTTEP